MRRMTRGESARHMTELTNICVAVTSGEASVDDFRAWVKRCIKEGRPVNAQALHVPDFIVETEIRHVILALPRLSQHHGDARAWLTAKMGHAPKQEGVVGWNLICGGIDVSSPESHAEEASCASDDASPGVPPGERRAFMDLKQAESIFLR